MDATLVHILHAHHIDARLDGEGTDRSLDAAIPRYTVNGSRRSFALLRQINAGDVVDTLSRTIIAAYQASVEADAANTAAYQDTLAEGRR